MMISDSRRNGRTLVALLATVVTVFSLLAVAQDAQANVETGFKTQNKRVAGPGWYHNEWMVKQLGGVYLDADLYAHVSYVGDNYMKVDDVRWRLWRWGPGVGCFLHVKLYNAGAAAGTLINPNMQLLVPPNARCGSGSQKNQWNLVVSGRATINERFMFRGGCVRTAASATLGMFIYAGMGSLEAGDPLHMNLGSPGCWQG